MPSVLGPPGLPICRSHTPLLQVIPFVPRPRRHFLTWQTLVPDSRGCRAVSARVHSSCTFSALRPRAYASSSPSSSLLARGSLVLITWCRAGADGRVAAGLPALLFAQESLPQYDKQRPRSTTASATTATLGASQISGRAQWHQGADKHGGGWPQTLIRRHWRQSEEMAVDPGRVEAPGGICSRQPNPAAKEMGSGGGGGHERHPHEITRSDRRH